MSDEWQEDAERFQARDGSYNEPPGTMKKPFCCFVSDEGKDCGKDAEFTVYGGSGHPEDYTESCEAHLGAMLGTPSWLEKPDQSWTVVLLPPAVSEGAPTEALSDPLPTGLEVQKLIEDWADARDFMNSIGHGSRGLDDAQREYKAAWEKVRVAVTRLLNASRRGSASAPGEGFRMLVRDAIAQLDASGFPGGFSTENNPTFDAVVERIVAGSSGLLAQGGNRDNCTDCGIALGGDEGDGTHQCSNCLGLREQGIASRRASGPSDAGTDEGWVKRLSAQLRASGQLGDMQRLNELYRAAHDGSASTAGRVEEE